MPELRIVLTIVALLTTMMLAAAIGTTQRIGAVMLALLSFAWLTLDREFEGQVLLHISSKHSLVSADIVGLLGLACALALWWRLRRR